MANNRDKIHSINLGDHSVLLETNYDLYTNRISLILLQSVHIRSHIYKQLI